MESKALQEYGYVYGNNYCLISNLIARLCSSGIRASVLGVRNVVDEDTENSFDCDFRLCEKGKLHSGYYHIVFSQPESFISCKYGREVLKNKTYQGNICAIVVDEAHCILEWSSDFRTDYSKLGVLQCSVPILAISATENLQDQEYIKDSLCLQSCGNVVRNPDRTNIYYEKFFRRGQEIDSVESILYPIGKGLLKDRTDYPLTVILYSPEMITQPHSSTLNNVTFLPCDITGKPTLCLDSDSRLQLQIDRKTIHVFVLILLAGDVATNPGPCSSTQDRTKLSCLRIMYLNARSLKVLVDSPDDDNSQNISKLTIFQNLVYLNQNELRSSRKLLLEGEQNELLMIELYLVNCTKFILGVFYRPPNSDVDTLIELRNSLDRLEESCQLVLNISSFMKVLMVRHICAEIICNVPELITDVNCVNPTDLFPSDHYLIEFDIKLCFQKEKAVENSFGYQVTNTPPWIDREVQHLINKKYTALRQYQLTRTEERKRKLRKLRQETKNLIKLKRQRYFGKVQDSFTKSPKSYWSYHKHILYNRISPSTNTYNNVTATTPNKNAELFNEYFASVFLPKSTSKNIDLNMTPKTDQEISQTQISEYEVEQLDTSKAYGPDGIPPLSKVLERSVFNSIYPFVHVLINNGQHGFLQNRSCVTQLLGVLHDIGKNLDQNKQTDTLYLDFSKAFDSVDHDILLYKLQRQGVNDNVSYGTNSTLYADDSKLYREVYQYNKTIFNLTYGMSYYLRIYGYHGHHCLSKYVEALDFNAIPPCENANCSTSKPNSICQPDGHEGKHKCICNDDFFEENNKCLDKKPCQRNPCRGDQKCTPIVATGGRNCTCEKHFIEINGTCEPVSP
ncbi:RNA-directed DNA polymerase from mobile element jockey, partial [Paramuricea clavata]